ncbi:hypothetical protein [Streptomyces sp. NBC_01429]|uniref:hypothetical protein n=1 Tax=Streptomyces sp. NBC_01429 TaxID=2903862 RepID=UPI002E2B8EFF|nr:hypothetical protein [Streptomyces sp. NBC_01429]
MNPTPETETPEQTTADATDTKDTKPPATDLSKETADGTAEDPATKDAAPADSPTGPAPAPAADGTDDNDYTDDDDDDDAADDAATAGSSGLGSAAAAVLAVCLGIVALTGTWSSRVLGERQGLVGQLKTGQSATAEQQISAIYGDAWHLTALVNGGVALVALIVGAIVLALPRPRTAWVRPFALAGAVLGLLGLLMSLGMYFDLFAALPTTAS